MSDPVSLSKLFSYYKQLGDKAMAQVNDEDLHEVLATDANSIAIIVRHMAGNMRSRFTEFLTSDGEKPWRDRDSEFVDANGDRAALLADWESGWSVFFATLATLTDADLERTVYIRNEGQSVMDALHRQLAHYAYHVGQIVLLARAFAGDQWSSLSIPRNASKAFNDGKFAQPKAPKHFTDGK
ncbi:MAG: DUF1572 family protein [Flavobacteriales bacterium]